MLNKTKQGSLTFKSTAPPKHKDGRVALTPSAWCEGKRVLSALQNASDRPGLKAAWIQLPSSGRRFSTDHACWSSLCPARRHKILCTCQLQVTVCAANAARVTASYYVKLLSFSQVTSRHWRTSCWHGLNGAQCCKRMENSRSVCSFSARAGLFCHTRWKAQRSVGFSWRSCDMKGLCYVWRFISMKWWWVLWNQWCSFPKLHLIDQPRPQ